MLIQSNPIQKSNPIDQILGNRYRDFSNRYFSLTIQSISTIDNFIDFSSIFLSIFLDNFIDISLYFHRYFSIFSSIFLDIFITFYLLFEKLFHCSLTILSSFPQGCKSYLMISFQSTIHPIFIDFSTVFLSIFLDIFIDISRYFHR